MWIHQYFHQYFIPGAQMCIHQYFQQYFIPGVQICIHQYFHQYFQQYLIPGVQICIHQYFHQYFHLYFQQYFIPGVQICIHQAPDYTQNQVTAVSTPTLPALLWGSNLLFEEGRSMMVNCGKIKGKKFCKWPQTPKRKNVLQDKKRRPQTISLAKGGKTYYLGNKASGAKSRNARNVNDYGACLHYPANWTGGFEIWRFKSGGGGLGGVIVPPGCTSRPLELLAHLLEQQPTACCASGPWFQNCASVHASLPYHTIPCW